MNSRPDRVTNASVRTLFLDAIAKNNILQSSYGRSLKLIVELGLKMSGLPTANKEFDAQVIFSNPLPTDYTELANQLQIIANIGAISKRTVANKMDLNWAFEQAAMGAEQEQAMKQQEAQMALMQKFRPDPNQQDNKSNNEQNSKKNLTQ